MTLALLASACGGDKPPNGGANQRPPAASVDERSFEDDERSDFDVVVDEPGQLGVFPFLLDDALAGFSPVAFGDGDEAAGAFGGYEEGDPALKKYLLDQSDLPDGYDIQDSVTAKLPPDAVAGLGGVNAAASFATMGDPESPDPVAFGAVMSLVARPDDPGDLDRVFDELTGYSQDDLLEMLSGDLLPGMDPPDIDMLNVDGLGDEAWAVGVSFDLGKFFAGLAAGFSDEEMPPSSELEQIENLGQMTMRVYFFRRGDYAGSIVRISFGPDSARNVDDLALAKIVDEKLLDAE
jgi:hypothetical protein